MSTFIEQRQFYEEPELEESSPRKAPLWKKIAGSKVTKGVGFVSIFALVCPVVLYYFIIERGIHNEPTTYSCLLNSTFRVPCGKTDVTQEECESIDCCYNATAHVCYHYIPSKYGYEMQSDGAYKTAQKTSPYESKTVDSVKVTIVEHTEDSVSVILHDESQAIEPNSLENKNYGVEITDSPLSVRVWDSDKHTIFNTIYGPLIASEKYWEWTMLLTNETLFGLDRNRIRLEGNESLTKVIYNNRKDHSTTPVFWAYQQGKFHGCAIRHDGPLEITILSSNLIILRSLVGKKIELKLTLGPTPQNLHDRMMETFVLHPPWTLGTHICRRSNDIGLDKVLDIYLNNKETKFDTDCIHENLFTSLALSGEENGTDYRTYIEEMTAGGTKFLLSLPPQIVATANNSLYNISEKLGVLYSTVNGTYKGEYLGRSVAYPDFSHPSIRSYIEELVELISAKIGMDEISGFVLNDNWPDDSSYKKPDSTDLPYMSDALYDAMSYTLPWNLLTYDKTYQMEQHNSYGSLQNSSLHNYFSSNPNLSSLEIISATKNYGDVELEVSENFDTSWDNFRLYLQRTLFNSITGNHMVGLPVCGDTTVYDKDLHETLCIRWYLAAATMPHFRVSSVKPFRDPENLNSKFATRYALDAIEKRKMFQEHYYTILSRGEPIVRPMYYDYYQNITTMSLDRQYTIGKNIIVVHPLSSARSALQVFLPSQVKVWYEIWGGGMYTSSPKDNFISISIVETDWVSFVAEGTIIPLTNNLELNFIIALNCTTSDCEASGELYKDLSYLQFSANLTALTISDFPKGCDYVLGYIKVYYYNDTGAYHDRHDKSKSLCPAGSETTVVVVYDEDDPEETTIAPISV
ncbi:lysosomal alpha-glucosidase-like [Cylas formicarius]|uniref:lysosomal alpha-glucosidase-like n=1 Tax=Cylas formicarius TaxID=197179 RepID=UPI0029587295|nr:lysosomal alpha-glucosidase-like [Cylas formicarius]XP_060526957.1 lysosomal alpha-glucosidase-like [Cylas formicarius]